MATIQINQATLKGRLIRFCKQTCLFMSDSSIAILSAKSDRQRAP